MAASGRPSIQLALVTAVGLSLLFLVVYEFTSWVTSLRSDSGSVGTWVYAWERWIPIVPIMILPYISIDLLFVAGPFLCTDREELRLLTRRIAMAILIAGACFLLMPLQLGHPRPEPAGWLEPVFRWFWSLDRPYNLFPSLHIALRTILAALYARHTRGAMWLLSHAWFSLIGLSTLLVGQHHVIDVVGGFALAAICFWAITPAPWRVPSEGNVRVGAWYALGGLGCAAAALLLRGHGGWALWWPAAVLGLLAAVYLLGERGPGGAIYRKRDGAVPFATKLVLAPTLIGQWVSWAFYRRRTPAWNEIAPRLWMGRALSEGEARDAIASGVVAVVDLTAEFSAPRAFRDVAYLNLPLLDLTAPTGEQLSQAMEFIECHATRGTVYVHCKAGYSRSAAVVGSVLLDRGVVREATSATSFLRAKRPGLVVRPEALASLKRAERR